MRHAFHVLLVMTALVALRQPLDAQACAGHQFTANSQSSSSYIRYCVTDNGNITSIISPFDFPQVGSPEGNPYDEGYGLCQESPIAEYHDYYTWTSGNWDPAIILSSSSSVIKISRRTADGNWTLVQTISKIAATGSIKIVMALTNNQSVEKVAYLLRFVDTYELGFAVRGGSLNSAWRLWPPSQLHYGLELLNAAKSPFAYRQGFVKDALTIPNPCDFAAGTDADGFQADQVDRHLLYVYAGPVPAKGTRTVTLNYRVM
jgi:hypothetical protein